MPQSSPTMTDATGLVRTLQHCTMCQKTSTTVLPLWACDEQNQMSSSVESFLKGRP